jgi:hypothetical protein
MAVAIREPLSEGLQSANHRVTRLGRSWSRFLGANQRLAYLPAHQGVDHAAADGRSIKPLTSIATGAASSIKEPSQSDPIGSIAHSLASLRGLGVIQDDHSFCARALHRADTLGVVGTRWKGPD